MTLRTSLATAVLALTLVPVPGAAAGVAAGAEASTGAQECPEIVVLAARGSEQNEYLEPTRYSETSRWESNGYEAETIRTFLHYSEARHLAKTGESLFEDILVMGLDESVYPASLSVPALAEKGEDLDGGQMVGRLGEILSETPAHVIAGDAVGGLVGGLHSGVTGTVDYLDAWEAETGCRPGYILVGFSQGALVLLPQEEELKRRGQLAGSLYLGNPLHGVVTASSRSDSLSYCMDEDFACNLTSSTGQAALRNGGGIHDLYFHGVDGVHPDDDAAVADRFADWVTGYTSRS